MDRLASAWLIRRFIDPEARFLWLKSPADCPKKALGFDFDGAAFTHVGARATFETLLASFDLETPPLVRLWPFSRPGYWTGPGPSRFTAPAEGHKLKLL